MAPYSFPRVPQGPGGPLAAKMARYIDLSESETLVLERMQMSPRQLPRRADIVVHGRTCETLFVLIEGVALRYKLLAAGKRQIVNVLLPGDLIGFPACFFEKALYGVVGLTNTVVSTVSFGLIAEMFYSSPRLAMAFYWAAAHEAAMYAERLVGLGRKAAHERLAHFLLELLARLRCVGLADACSYRLPLTQEEVGDILGLSTPHVNRMFRELREQGLLLMDGQHLRFPDVETLASLAKFEESYLTGGPVFYPVAIDKLMGRCSV